MSRHTFIVSDESVNKYGFRVLTKGIDFAEFSRNAVMFWNHKTDNGHDDRLPIGRWENLRIEGDKLLADAVFDMNDELGRIVANKVANGFLNACSIGIGVEAMSDKAELMAEGQTRPTITRSILEEISIVDIPANSNAMKLRRDRELVTLSANMDINKLDRIMDKVKLGAALAEQAAAAVDKYVADNEVEAMAAEQAIAEFAGVSVEDLQAVKAGEACATYEVLAAIAEITGAELQPMIDAAIADGCEVVMPEEEMKEDKEEEEMFAPTLADQVNEALRSFLDGLKKAFKFVPREGVNAEEKEDELFHELNGNLSGLKLSATNEVADLAHEIATLKAELASMKAAPTMEKESVSLKKSGAAPTTERKPMIEKEEERPEAEDRKVLRSMGEAAKMFLRKND